MKGWALFVRGFAMGIADMVPGISGGTVAFLTGIYLPLTDALTRGGRGLWLFFRGDAQGISQSRQALRVLVPLGLGMALGILMLIKPLQGLLRDPDARPWLMVLFLGLMLGSIRLCCSWARWTSPRLLVFLVAGVALGWGGSSRMTETWKGSWSVRIAVPPETHAENLAEGWVTQLHASQVRELLHTGRVQRTDLRSEQGEELEEQRSWQIEPKLIAASAWALCAMLLPGISGTYMLQLCGEYERILGAIERGVFGALHGHWDGAAWVLLVQVISGFLLGAALFALVIQWVWKRFPDALMTGMVGIMVGGLHVLWPWRRAIAIWNPVQDQIQICWGECTVPSAVLETAGAVGILLIGAAAVSWMGRRGQLRVLCGSLTHRSLKP